MLFYLQKIGVADSYLTGLTFNSPFQICSNYLLTTITELYSKFEMQ